MITLFPSVGSVMLLNSIVLDVGRFSCVVRVLAFRRTSALIGAVPNRGEAFGTVQSVMPVNASSRLVMRGHLCCCRALSLWFLAENPSHFPISAFVKCSSVDWLG